MVKHAAEIGWTPITPEVAKQKRGGEAGMLFRDELEAKLAEFNPWMTATPSVDHRDARRDPADDRGQPRDALLAARRAAMVRRGREASPPRPARSISSTPSANVFHVSWEWTLKPPARKGNRADVMFVINGVPVCIVEHKNPKDGDAIERGDQAASPLRDRDARADRRAAALQRHPPARLLVWRHLERHPAVHGALEADARRGLRFAVQSFFEPTDFLRTLQHWILFYVEDSETRKSVLRQHQRRAIDKIVAPLRRPGEERAGSIWHTQGSGKTFTLLTAARLILEDKERFKNATVILVVDRTELEGQLKGWVERLLGEMQQQDIAGLAREH